MYDKIHYKLKKKKEYIKINDRSEESIYKSYIQ